MKGAIISGIWALVFFIGVIFVAFKIWQVPDIPELITCEERYVGDTYWGEVKYRDGEFIYLDGYKSIDVICTPYKDMVDEETPLCGTQVEFKWPLDTSNMNCYEEWNPKSIIKAFKKQVEDERKEEQNKYYACDLDTEKMVGLFNSCSEIECARYRIAGYLKEACPRATIK